MEYSGGDIERHVELRVMTDARTFPLARDMKASSLMRVVLRQVHCTAGGLHLFTRSGPDR
jgi:hypothetical protein